MIGDRIQREYDGLSRVRLKRDLLDALAEQVGFEAPQGMVDQEFAQIWQRLEAADKALGYHPDMPALDLIKAVAHNNLGQWERGLRCLQSYQELLGDDGAIERFTDRLALRIPVCNECSGTRRVREEPE